jgi:lipid-A-disaccharide synthase
VAHLVIAGVLNHSFGLGVPLFLRMIGVTFVETLSLWICFPTLRRKGGRLVRPDTRADETSALRVFFSAGEVSGDVAAAHLARELRERHPDAVLWGVGGARMAAAGIDVISPTNHLGRVGITESFSAIPALLRVFRDVRRRLDAQRTDVAVLIANDVFNAILGRWLRRRGVRTIAWFPPQAWIWRSLMPLFAGSYDTVLACFPEEVDAYAPRVRDTRFVGHYLCDVLAPATQAERLRAREGLALPAVGRVIGLLPGSREHELRVLTPPLFDAAAELARRDPTLRFVVPLAEERHTEFVSRELRKREIEDRVRLVSNSHDAMRAADLLLVASGTATLEAAIIGTPMIVVYRLSLVSISIVRFCIRLSLIRSETVGLPNLILGRDAIPEFRQEHLRANKLADFAEGLLASRVRLDRMRDDLDDVRTRLHAHGTLDLVVSAVGMRASSSARVLRGMR